MKAGTYPAAASRCAAATRNARRVIITAIVTVMVLVAGAAAGSGTSIAPAADRSPERIQFRPGTVGTTVSGKIGGGGSVAYVFRARAGQFVHVHGFEATTS